MLAASLISDDLWSDIPEDNDEAFLRIAEAAHRRLTALLNGPEEDLGPYSRKEWKRQFVWELEAVASELGITGLVNAAAVDQNESAFDTHASTLARVLTRIKIAKRASFKNDSAALSYKTKDDIRRQLETLRNVVNKSNLSDKAKAGLHAKIDAAESELDKTRSGLTPFWSLAGALNLAAGSMNLTSALVGGLADLPQAAKTLSSLIDAMHGEKIEEEKEHMRRNQPPLLDYEPPMQLTDQSQQV